MRTLRSTGAADFRLTGKGLAVVLVRHKVIVAALLVALALLSIAHEASAGWLAWVGVGLLVAAVVLIAFPAAVAAGVAAATGGAVVVSEAVVIGTGVASLAAGIVAIAVDFGNAIAMAPDTNKPALAALPEPATPPAAAVPASLAPIATPGNEADAAVAAANDLIDAGNTLLEHADSDPAQVPADFANVTDGFGELAEEVSNVFEGQEAIVPELTFTQSEIDATLAAIEASGFPEPVVDALTELGLSTSNVDALAAYVSATDVNLAGPDVTISDLLTQGASLRLVPEPGSLVLLASAVLALFSHFRARNVRKTAHCFAQSAARQPGFRVSGHY